MTSNIVNRSENGNKNHSYVQKQFSNLILYLKYMGGCVHLDMCFFNAPSLCICYKL